MSGFDAFVDHLDPSVVKSVRNATVKVTRARVTALQGQFADSEKARRHAMEVKRHVLDNLRTYLLQLEEKCQSHGIQVHWAETAEEARSVIGGICTNEAGHEGVIVKAKSMATEEIHLNAHLQDLGFEVVETDLGEFVVQIDGDTPSHIVAPIIHKNRNDIGASFLRNGLGPFSVDPEVLASQARSHLRSKFRTAKIGISGVNFAVAETGRLVLVENEGNNRLSTTAPRVHIALMGMEKILPREADLPLFLKLLAGSATGQLLTVYTHLISGPRKPSDLDGPDEVHLVILDNGRTKVLNGEFKDILRCIRCGACLNVCPVYRQASGHAYSHVYAGPLGAVLAPALEGIEKAGSIAKASSLCGACEEVCPVRIPIPEMLLKIRSQLDQPRLPWELFGSIATNRRRWTIAGRMLPILGTFPNPWKRHRESPKRVGRDFRGWWNERS